MHPVYIKCHIAIAKPGASVQYRIFGFREAEKLFSVSFFLGIRKIIAFGCDYLPAQRNRTEQHTGVVVFVT